MKRNIAALLIAFNFCLFNQSIAFAKNNTIAPNEYSKEVINALSQDEMNRLNKINTKSKTLLRKLYKSSDKCLSAARAVLKSLNKNDRVTHQEHSKLRQHLTSPKFKQLNLLLKKTAPVGSLKSSSTASGNEDETVGAYFDSYKDDKSIKDVSQEYIMDFKNELTDVSSSCGSL